MKNKNKSKIPRIGYVKTYVVDTPTKTNVFIYY